MRTSLRHSLALVAVLILGPAVSAQTDLQKQLKDTAIGSHWIYDDFAKATAVAKETGKPILALFR